MAAGIFLQRAGIRPLIPPEEVTGKEYVELTPSS